MATTQTRGKKKLAKVTKKVVKKPARKPAKQLKRTAAMKKSAPPQLVPITTMPSVALFRQAYVAVLDHKEEEVAKRLRLGVTDVIKLALRVQLSSKTTCWFCSAELDPRRDGCACLINERTGYIEQVAWRGHELELRSALAQKRIHPCLVIYSNKCTTPGCEKYLSVSAKRLVGDVNQKIKSKLIPAHTLVTKCVRCDPSPAFLKRKEAHDKQQAKAKLVLAAPAASPKHRLTPPEHDDPEFGTKLIAFMEQQTESKSPAPQPAAVIQKIHKRRRTPRDPLYASVRDQLVAKGLVKPRPVAPEMASTTPSPPNEVDAGADLPQAETDASLSETSERAVAE